MQYKSALHGWRSWPVKGQHKNCTKKCLEFEKNAVDHTIIHSLADRLAGTITKV